MTLNLDDLTALDYAIRQAHTANAVLLVDADEQETKLLVKIAGHLERAQFGARELRVVPAAVKDERKARADLYGRSF